MRVAAAQLRIEIGRLEANRAGATRAVREAAGAGARLVVLPELAVSGYVFSDAEEARMLGEDLDGPTVAEWTGLARELDLVLVGGLCERSPTGGLYNSSVLIDGQGVRAVYRKAHLWDRESEVFERGRQEPPIVETQLGRIGMLICYDLEFPEWVRRVAVGGAELIAAPTNWPSFPRPEHERPIEVVRVQANASVNRIFIVAADRCGSERGVDWVGGSVIASPDGFPLAGPVCADREAVIVAECALADAREKSIGPRNDVHADRRLDLY